MTECRLTLFFLVLSPTCSQTSADLLSEKQKILRDKTSFVHQTNGCNLTQPCVAVGHLQFVLGLQIKEMVISSANNRFQWEISLHQEEEKFFLMDNWLKEWFQKLQSSRKPDGGARNNDAGDIAKPFLVQTSGDERCNEAGFSPHVQCTPLVLSMRQVDSPTAVSRQATAVDAETRSKN